ncbi:MAG: trimethylamine methyltransferase family protein [Alphaproteobacteria bacterium]|nr:trimethylamine methyltransferase family protein [Alphaproteobacteria bacterium]
MGRSSSRQRTGRRSAAKSKPSKSITSPTVVRRIKPYEILDEAGLVAVEDTAERILSEVGVEIRDDEPSLELFREAGAQVSGTRVRFEPGMCRSIIQASAPSKFTQHARNPERSVEIGGDNIVFVPAYGAPFVRASDIERRYARLEDFETIVKLAYLTPHMHHSGGTVCEPTDIPVSKRHLDMVHAHLRLSDKPYMGGVTSGERAEDSIRMTEIVFGEKFVSENCCVLGLINVNSPLVLDGTMLAALRVYAAAGQGTVITPFVIGGAGGPVTSAGMLAQSLAETLVGIALTQLVRPGVPVIFGYLSTGLNMKSGAPVRYDETWKCFLAAGQLARRLGVPYRCGSATSAAKLPDYQAGLESALNFEAALLSGAHFMIHASGNVEGGLCVDLDKLLLDCEMLGMAARFAGGVDTSQAALAFDAIKEAGPGGNFLVTAHTLERYRDAFFAADLFDTTPYEHWRDAGELTSTEQARTRRLALLNAYEPPPMDQSIADALDDFVRTRKSELPDSFV